MEIGPAKESDAANLLSLYEALDSETEFMFFEPGERQTSVEKIQARIHAATDSDAVTMYVARDEGLVAGFVAGFCNAGERNKHVANIVLGVRSSHWGRGIGRELLRAVEMWARDNEKSKLELTVMRENSRAIGLYRSEGFDTEGTKLRSVKLKSGYQDELYMGKLLD